jgi:Fe-S cluster assembly protein SufD
MSGSAVEKTESQETAVLALHKKFLGGQQANASLRSVNEAGIKRFELLKFPHKKHEMYTFVNTHELAGTSFELAGDGPVDTAWVQDRVYPACKNSVAVFVNGAFQDNLSDLSGLGDSFKIQCLSDAVVDDEIKQTLVDSLEEENDVFAALNSAFVHHGVLIDIPSKATFDTPVQLLYVSTGTASGAVVSYPRLVVRLGEMAELNVLPVYVGTRANYCVNAVNDFIIKDGAGVTCTQVQKDDAESWHVSKTRVQIHRDARFFGRNGSSGSRLTRHHYEIHLKEEGAELLLSGATVLVHQEQVHNFIRIHHEAPHCTSEQLFKNVINDKGRSSVDGTVIVNKGAQLTNSNQLINNLMLSDEAHADNKPNLMIFADDVKCTHGTTVGQIDEDQLFYLKTRGLSEALAKSLLTTSFVNSLIQTIPFPDVVADLNELLLKKLEAKHA